MVDILDFIKFLSFFFFYFTYLFHTLGSQFKRGEYKKRNTKVLAKDSNAHEELNQYPGVSREFSTLIDIFRSAIGNIASFEHKHWVESYT